MLDKVEKIREKTGVSYEDAKAALEAANGDVLDALVWLENEGKLKKPEQQFYSTGEKKEASEELKEAVKAYEEDKSGTFSNMMKRFWNWCRKWLVKSRENFFVVTRGDTELINVPVLVLLILLLIGFWVTVVLLIAGLFFGCRYSFRGDITKKVDINGACDKAAEAAEAVKNEFSKK